MLMGGFFFLRLAVELWKKRKRTLREETVAWSAASIQLKAVGLQAVVLQCAEV